MANPCTGDLDEALNRLLPLDEHIPHSIHESTLLIFDGTANQKLPILMWMCDQVLTTLKQARENSRDQRKTTTLDIIEHSFVHTFARIRVLVSDLTDSISPYPEHFRKLFIEHCATIVQAYRRHVEHLAGISRRTPPPSPDIDRREVEQFIAFCQNHRQNNANSAVATSVNTSATTSPTSLTPPQRNYEIPRAAVPMTRISGAPNSIYVSPKPKGINIHNAAYADQHRETAMIPYDMHVNQTYEEVLQGVPKNLTYVGALYPDGTSLSYLPIKDTTLLQRNTEVQHPTKEEGGVVELLLPKVIYRRIKKLCAEAYLRKYPDHAIRFPFECVLDHHTVKIHALARGYRRMRIINGKRVFHVSLIQALQHCSHDMAGDGLLHLRFDRPNSDHKRATMKVIFFGLQMVRNASNHFQKIFRL